MKRYTYYIALLCSLFMLMGCNEPKGRQTYAWVIATASPENTVTGIFANTFAEKVNELSKGELRMQVYHNSVLGGDTELLESCQCGDIPFVVQNTAPEVSYMPELCLFDLPCAFANVEDLHKVLDNERFMTKVNGIYERSDFHLLAFADQNFRVMTSNKKVQDLADLRGIKIRTMENSHHITFWKALGANPTPMAFSELYVGLEQHTVDAQENPYEVICSNGFYEVQDYVIETNHLPHLLALVTNQDFYGKLPDTSREIIDQAAALARDEARRQAVLRTSDKIKEIEQGGAELVPVSEKMRQDMLKASEPLYKQIRGIVNDNELMELYISNNK